MKKNHYTQYKILKTSPKKGDILLFNYKRPLHFIEKDDACQETF